MGLGRLSLATRGGVAAVAFDNPFDDGRGGPVVAPDRPQQLAWPRLRVGLGYAW